MNTFNTQQQLEETTEFETGELMNEVNKEEYKTTWTYTDENWTCEIREYQASLGNGKFSTNYLAIFTDKISGGYICQHYNTISCCGRMFIERLEHHYLEVVPKHFNLGQQEGFATRRLNAEDAIDARTAPGLSPQ